MITSSCCFYLSSRSFDSINTAAVILQSGYPAQLARAGVSTSQLKGDRFRGLRSEPHIANAQARKMESLEEGSEFYWNREAVNFYFTYKKATRQQGDLLFKGE
jgi:hypothetical protein